MAAERRGGARSAAKPRATPAASPAPRGKPASAGVRTGLSSKLILAAAAGALVLAGGIALGTGGRGEKLAATVGMGVDASFGDAGFRLHQVHVQGASPMATADIV